MNESHKAGNGANNNLNISQRTSDLNGSGNLNGSLKIAGGQPKSSTKSSVTRSKPLPQSDGGVAGGAVSMAKDHAQTMPSTVIPSKLKVNAVKIKKSQDSAHTNNNSILSKGRLVDHS